MRILVTTTRLSRAGQTVLSDAGADIRTVADEANERAVMNILGEFDPVGVISRGHQLTDSMMAAAPSLRAIAKTGAGVDNIDLEAATRRKVVVLSNTGGNSQAVAEHALGFMLALARNTARHDALMRAGIWSRFNFRAQELSGKRLGLVGFGPSAQRLAPMALALGMTVSVHAPRYRFGGPGPGITIAGSLPELLRSADIVSLHCSLNAQTRGMIGRDAIAAMRRGSWLINIARGPIIDKTALIEGLRSGRLGGAALDVHEQEPMPPVHELFGMDNVVLTPHVAGATLQSAERAHAAAARNLLAALAGQGLDPRSVANPDVLR